MFTCLHISPWETYRSPQAEANHFYGICLRRADRMGMFWKEWIKSRLCHNPYFLLFLLCPMVLLPSCSVTLLAHDLLHFPPPLFNPMNIRRRGRVNGSDVRHCREGTFCIASVPGGLGLA